MNYSDTKFNDIDLDELDQANTAYTSYKASDPDRLARLRETNPELYDEVFAPFGKPEPEPVAKKRRRKRPGDLPKKGSAAYQQRLDLACEGLPPFSDTHWMCVQLHDHGSEAVRGRTRYAVKIETSILPAAQSTRSTIQNNKRTRWANLSTTKRFRINVRDNKTMDEVTRRIALALAERAAKFDAAMAEYGAPPCLLGRVETRFEGTHTFAGQFALVDWEPAQENDEIVWLPVVTLTQPGDDLYATREIKLATPPPINRDGSPRSANRFTHVGTWYSAELQARIDEGKRIKAERREVKP